MARVQSIAVWHFFLYEKLIRSLRGPSMKFWLHNKVLYYKVLITSLHVQSTWLGITEITKISSSEFQTWKNLRVYRGEKWTQVITIEGRGKSRGKKCSSSMLKGNARLLPDERIPTASLEMWALEPCLIYTYACVFCAHIKIYVYIKIYLYLYRILQTFYYMDTIQN